MKQRRFRNHASVIVEKVGGVMLAFVVLVVSIVVKNIDVIQDLEFSLREDGRWLFLLSGMLALLLFILLRSILLWAKTWITIKDELIIIEQNTMQQKVNTIRIRHLANINLEQNLFEMLMGTCTVKLDTNSRSTAETTDVKLVLKKPDAERLRLECKQLMQGEDLCHDEAVKAETKVSRCIVTVSRKALLLHGLYSLHILSLFIFFGSLWGVVELIHTASESLTSIFLLLMAIASAFWSNAKGFIHYHGFQVERIEDRLHIRYGLLKKVEYTVPVAMLQAIRLHQTLLARLLHKYKVEIINIGMGDENSENSAFLLLYADMPTLLEQMRIVLPEAVGITNQAVKRQTNGAWLAWLPGWMLYLLFITLGCVCFKEWSACPTYVIYIMFAGLSALSCLWLLLKYMASGFVMDETFVKVASGYFGRRFIIVKYQNIQYITYSQNFLAKLMHIQKGSLYILAASLHTHHALPYMTNAQAEKLREHFVQSDRNT